MEALQWRSVLSASLISTLLRLAVRSGRLQEKETKLPPSLTSVTWQNHGWDLTATENASQESLLLPGISKCHYESAKNDLLCLCLIHFVSYKYQTDFHSICAILFIFSNAQPRLLQLIQWLRTPSGQCLCQLDLSTLSTCLSTLATKACAQHVCTLQALLQLLGGWILS